VSEDKPAKKEGAMPKRLVEYWSETAGTVTLHDLRTGKKLPGIEAKSATAEAAQLCGCSENEILLGKRESPRQQMKIAILGWGSLVWNPRNLSIINSAWHPDGVLLPIEFARISRDGRLTLVLYQQPNQRNVLTLWAESQFQKFDAARNNLKECEGCALDAIGYVTAEGALPSVSDDLKTRIGQWAVAKEFDAVIWTELPSNFQDKQKVPLSPADAVAYLRGLQSDAKTAEAAKAAKEYVQRAPAQVRTEIREHIESELGWLPQSTDPTSVTSVIKSPDDLRIKEWEQCRTTVGRLDTILADLRKFGFSLITGLLTASAFLALLGVQTTQNLPTAPIEARVSPFMVIMVLIAALFSVDSYYQVLLSAAVDRALDLEVKTDPWMRVTKYLSVNAMLTKSTYVTLFLYLLLLAAAAGLAVFAVGGLGLKLWSTGPLGIPEVLIDNIGSWGGLVWVLLAAVIACILLYKFVIKKETPLWRGFLVLGAVTLWLTLGLGALMFAAAKCKRTDVAAASWVVALATFLAIYVEAYWVSVNIKSGLYREKPNRSWPEDAAKAEN
jgi:hypothetical protein